MSPTLLLAGAASAALLLGAGLFRWRKRGRAQQRRQALQQGLLLCLELLQRIQKHRGLGGQNGAPARQQCQALAAEIDDLWRGAPADLALDGLRQRWLPLRQQAGDFDGHCQLIEQLLEYTQLLELRLCGLHAEPAGIARDCRELEELARLRGLAVRGAGAPRCPLPLQVQLRYLSQRLQPRAARQSGLTRALDSLQRQLIDPPRVLIAPAECFGLLTPLIDEQLGQLRQRLTMD